MREYAVHEGAHELRVHAKNCEGASCKRASNHSTLARAHAYRTVPRVHERHTILGGDENEVGVDVEAAAQSERGVLGGNDALVVSHEGVAHDLAGGGGSAEAGASGEDNNGGVHGDCD